MRSAPLAVVSMLTASAGLLAFATPCLAADRGGESFIDVDTTTDRSILSAPTGGCSLRQAISAANLNISVDGCSAGQPGQDVIRVPAGTYLLDLVGTGDDANLTGDLDITQDLIIRGVAPDEDAAPRVDGVAVIDGNASDRVFQIGPGATVRLEDLEVRNGRVAGTSATTVGGGILSQGNLTLSGCGVRSNTVIGLDPVSTRGSSPGGNALGGGIYSTGPLALESCSVTGNLAQGGEGNGAAVGGSGLGGAVAATGGLVLRSSFLSSNLAMGGEGGLHTSAGGLGTGGAIVVAGSATLSDSWFDSNSAVGGAPGPVQRASAEAPAGLSGKADAAGGAVYVAAGASARVERCTFSDNGATGGPGAEGGPDGGDAVGGSIHHVGSQLVVESSTFVDGSATGGTGARPGRSGGDGAGGAIAAEVPGAEILSSTFVGNRALGGAGGDSDDERRGTAGNGGSAFGGQLADLQPTRGLAAFVIGNTIVADGGVVAGIGGSPDGTPGSAVDAGCGGTTSTTLGNVEGPTGTCGFADDAGDLENVALVDLALGDLEDNGGPTPTVALLEGSVAIEFGIYADCGATDQRGFFRLDGTCDSGAYDTLSRERIFADRFETGDTGNWSEALGVAP